MRARGNYDETTGYGFPLDRELFQSRIYNSSHAATSERVEHPVSTIGARGLGEAGSWVPGGSVVGVQVAMSDTLVQSHPGLRGVLGCQRFTFEVHEHKDPNSHSMHETL